MFFGWLLSDSGRNRWEENTLSASAWSILFRAMTVGNFSSVNAFTTLSIVASDQCSRGSLMASLSRHRATVLLVLPYPENWF